MQQNLTSVNDWNSRCTHWTKFRNLQIGRALWSTLSTNKSKGLRWCYEEEKFRDGESRKYFWKLRIFAKVSKNVEIDVRIHSGIWWNLSLKDGSISWCVRCDSICQSMNTVRTQTETERKLCLHLLGGNRFGYQCDLCWGDGCKGCCIGGTEIPNRCEVVNAGLPLFFRKKETESYLWKRDQKKVLGHICCPKDTKRDHKYPI